jgi:hypothetical protein
VFGTVDIVAEVNVIRDDPGLAVVGGLLSGVFVATTGAVVLGLAAVDIAAPVSEG